MFAFLNRKPWLPERKEKEKAIRDAGWEWNVPYATLVTNPLTPVLEMSGAISIWVVFDARDEVST